MKKLMKYAILPRALVLLLALTLAVTASAMLGASPLLIGIIALVLVTAGPLVWRVLVRRFSVHLDRPAVQQPGASTPA